MDKDEALFLVDNTAYLHVWATDDSHAYAADGCYTSYDYIFYDKGTRRERESGTMELFDMWDDPQQNLRDAAGNILTCRLVTEGGVMEAAPLEMAGKLREAAFFAHEGDAFAVYRLKDPANADPNGYVPIVRLQRKGESPLCGNYDFIHTAPLAPGADSCAVLDEYRAYGRDVKLRPGDIVAFKQDGAVMCWYVDLLACSQLPGLLQNHLAAAEMSVEQNYNQIDSIINNEPPKPSVLDSLRQCQREAGKPHSEDAPPAPRRDQER